MNQLKGMLLKEYGRFADKRIKNLEKGRTFIVDGRTEDDVGSDGHLYSWFCMIFADVKGDNEVVVHMSGNIPKGANVDAWRNKNKVKDNERVWEFRLVPENYGILISLADAIESIVARGARYEVRSYKYVCPRTSEALRRLHSVLSRAWTSGPIGFGL